jgi:hypothetical protein
MNILKPVFLSVIAAAALIGNVATASERPPRVGEEKIVPKKPADPKTAPEASAKKPIKRRAVRQVLDDDIRPAAPAAVYAPTLTPPVAERPVHGVPPGPVNLNCVGATCTDSTGGRFNGGVGTTLISPQGKLCNNNGLTVQCF